MMRKLVITFVPGLVGGAIGAYLGYLAVGYFMSNFGVIVPILPGAFAGLACGQLSRDRSRVRGVINGLICLLITFYAHFRLFHQVFEFDNTFLGYLPHVHQISWPHLLVIAINAVIAGWWGREERIGAGRIKPQSPGESRDLSTHSTPT